MTNPTQTHNPAITLNNGVEIPALGLGVFLAPPEQTADAVQTAIMDGYRLIDTAAGYNNERQVGEGVRRTGVDRGEMFITTKLWVADYGYEPALRAFDASLRRLGVDYIDLYLLHWPVPTDFEKTVAAYKAAEEVLSEGRARAIGVSNFQPQHLEALIGQTDVVPAVNQIELHPHLQQLELRRFHEEHGIKTEAWGPLGRGQFLDDETIVRIAKDHSRTPAQVVLRWHIQLGNIVIPKSVTPSRIEENFAVFDFELSDDDMHALFELDRNERTGPDPGTFG